MFLFKTILFGIFTIAVANAANENSSTTLLTAEISTVKIETKLLETLYKSTTVLAGTYEADTSTTLEDTEAWLTTQSPTKNMHNEKIKEEPAAKTLLSAFDVHETKVALKTVEPNTSQQNPKYNNSTGEWDCPEGYALFDCDEDNNKIDPTCMKIIPDTNTTNMLEQFNELYYVIGGAVVLLALITIILYILELKYKWWHEKQ